MTCESGLVPHRGRRSRPRRADRHPVAAGWGRRRGRRATIGALVAWVGRGRTPGPTGGDGVLGCLPGRPGRAARRPPGHHPLGPGRTNWRPKYPTGGGGRRPDLPAGRCGLDECRGDRRHRSGPGPGRGRPRHRRLPAHRPVAGHVPAPARRADPVRHPGVDGAGPAVRRSGRPRPGWRPIPAATTGWPSWPRGPPCRNATSPGCSPTRWGRRRAGTSNGSAPRPPASCSSRPTTPSRSSPPGAASVHTETLRRTFHRRLRSSPDAYRRRFATIRRTPEHRLPTQPLTRQERAMNHRIPARPSPFPSSTGFTALDAIGPYEVLQRIPRLRRRVRRPPDRGGPQRQRDARHHP